MKKVSRFLTSLVSGLLGLCAGMTGCGGALYMGPPPSVEGTVLDKDADTPVAALRVGLLLGDTSLEMGSTDLRGYFYFTIPVENTNYTLRITDVDNTNNGGPYKGTTNTFHVEHKVQTNFYLEKQ